MKNVLIIDDDSESLTVISLILSASGFSANSIRNGAEVFKGVNKYKPDVILLDVHLGSEFDGRVICNDLKNDPTTKHIPIILISGTSHLEEVKAISNADDYISKPFGIDDLIDMVKRYSSIRA